MDMDAAPMLKRKGAEAPELWLDEDPASGFPVSSRATKIRRLDAEVMPPVVPGAGVPQPQPAAGFGVEEVHVEPAVVAPAANEEKAIVVYKPADAARNLLLGPLRPGVPLIVSPEWIHGFKNTMLQVTSNHRVLFEELTDESSNLAMVPWAPSQSQAASTTSAMVTEMMDANDEDSEGTYMEVEQDRCDQHVTADAPQGEALHKWPQNRMVQQSLPVVSYQPSPVTWSW